MSTFAASFVSFAAPMLLDQFAETVTYTPSGGSATSIDAILIRQQVETIGGMGEVGHRTSITAWMRESDVSTLAKNADTIAYKVSTTDAASVTSKVMEVLERTAGMVHVRLQ